MAGESVEYIQNNQVPSGYSGAVCAFCDPIAPRPSVAGQNVNGTEAPSGPRKPSQMGKN